jgi:CRISPR-associated protein Cas2
MRHVIAYDISNDRRRYQVAGLLLHYGVRIQRSVFECELDSDDLTQLLDRAEKLIDPTWDVIHAYALCERCEKSRRALGAPRTGLGERYYVV